jgi:hypothetical protein
VKHRYEAFGETVKAMHVLRFPPEIDYEEEQERRDVV